MKTETGEFHGEFDENYKYQGKGQLKLKNGENYYGDWEHGQKHGQF